MSAARLNQTLPTSQLDSAEVTFGRDQPGEVARADSFDSKAAAETNASAPPSPAALKREQAIQALVESIGRSTMFGGQECHLGTRVRAF